MKTGCGIIVFIVGTIFVLSTAGDGGFFTWVFTIPLALFVVGILSFIAEQLGDICDNETETDRIKAKKAELRRMEEERREREAREERERHEREAREERERREREAREERERREREAREERERQPRHFEYAGCRLTVVCDNWHEGWDHYYKIYCNGVFAAIYVALDAESAAQKFMSEHPRRANDEASDRHGQKKDSDQREAHNDKANEQRERKRESNQRKKRSYKRTAQMPEDDNTMDMDSACRILGVATDADNETIKKAWHERCKEFHPDFLRAKGLAQKFIDFATREQQRINAAYEYIKALRRFS